MMSDLTLWYFHAAMVKILFLLKTRFAFHLTIIFICFLIQLLLYWGQKILFEKSTSIALDYAGWQHSSFDRFWI